MSRRLTDLNAGHEKGSAQTLIWRLLLLVVIVPLVVIAHLIPGLDGSVIENGIRNALHVIGFAVFAAVVFEGTPGSKWVKSTLAVLLVAAVGFMSELAQTQVGRADVVDLFRDVAGAMVYVAARTLWSTHLTSGFLRATVRTVSILIGALVFAPLIYWMSIIGVYLFQSPIILDFDGGHDAVLLKPINSDIEILSGTGQIGDVGNRFGRIRLSGWGRSGVAIATVIHDWTSYSELVFDAEMIRGESTNVTVHINDHNHIGRFIETDAARINITEKPEQFRIPIRAVISELGPDNSDVSDIRQIVILARDKREGALLRLDNIRLESSN
jgi:hypothetical protein